MKDATKIILFVVGVVLLIGALTYAAIGASAPRGESTYTGVVIDVEHEKGLFLKTTQIHLKTHSRSSEVEEFCIITEDGTEDLGKARQSLRTGQKVYVEYSRPFWVSPTQCQSGLSIVNSLENATEEGSS